VHNVILHIISRDELADRVADGEYRAPSLADVGFTHCSDPGTVHLRPTPCTPAAPTCC